MKNLFKHPIIIFFLILIFTIPMLTLFNLGSELSTIENRALAARPEYNRQSLFSGEYFGAIEEYISDHIYLRDDWIKSYTLLNMNSLGKMRINDIVIGAEGTLLPYYTDELNNRLDCQLDNIAEMANKMSRISNLVESYGGEFLFVGVPGQSSFFRERYPFYMDNKDDYFNCNEDLFFTQLKEKNINYLNMNGVFRNDYREDYYLKTDHHYSFEGFFKTYQEIIHSLGMDPLNRSDFNIVESEEPILGSRNKQIYFLKETDERFKIANLKENLNYSKYIQGKEDSSLYYMPEGRPSYNIYMNGDHPEIVIDTARQDLPDLLLFGDSFTNAIEPLVFLHFGKTRILDLRYYKDMNLEEYIKLHRPDYLVMLRDDLNYGNLEGNGEF